MKKIWHVGLFTLLVVLLLPSFAAAEGVSITLYNVTPSNLKVGDAFTAQVEVYNATGAQEVIKLINGESSTLPVFEREIIVASKRMQDVQLYGIAETAGNHIVQVAVYGDPDNKSKTALVSVTDTTDDSNNPGSSSDIPLFAVTSVKLTPENPNPGDSFSVEFQLSNKGNSDADNTYVSFSGGKNFEVLDLTNRVLLGSVGSGSRKSVTYRLRANKDRESNTAELQFTYHNNGVKESFTETVNLPLNPVSQSPAKLPYLKISSFSVEPQEKEGDFLLRLQLKNQGSSSAQSIAIRLDSSEAFPRESSNVVFVPKLEAGSVKEITLKMTVASKDVTAYTIPIQIDYEDADKESYQGTETISILASSLGLAEQAQTGWRPRVMLSKYTLSEAQILAGDTVTLTLYIENSSNQKVGNIKFSLGLIPSGNNASDTVFSPVNSSNSGYIEVIGPKQVVAKELSLYVDPNATAKTYSVPVEIEYEDISGTAYQVAETVNIPVTQESRLQIISVDVPPVGGVGQPIPISAEFVNVGKVALKNFLVNIDGDFPKENASYFLASFEMGMSDFFQGMIIPQSEGVLSGKLVFTYTDNTNKEVTVEEPFEVTVQQMDMGGPEGPNGSEKPFPPDHSPPEENMGGLAGKLGWLIPLFVLLAGGGLFLFRKMRAKRGEGFDEDF